MIRFRRSFSFLFFLLICHVSYAQNVDVEEVSESATEEPTGISFGDAKTTHWKVGVIVTASRGPVKGVLCTIPEPTEWPEQTVKLITKKVTPGVRVSHRDLRGVQQLVVNIPKLGNKKRAEALFTYEVTRKTIVGPKETEGFVIPRKVPRQDRRWLKSSPYIDTRDSKIRSLAKEKFRSLEDEGAWKQVEGLYDLVRELVEYKEGSIKTASKALRDGEGDCEELTSLFIAMCRVNKVPARMVWIPDHCYPEFYLEDAAGKGHWLPCQAAGTRAFGEMPEMRPILQKGDNFKVPEKPKPQRYVAEFMTGKPATRGAGEPSHQFVRELTQPGV